jgi:hypothetical protein
MCWKLGDWSSEHEQFANFATQYVMMKVLTGIRVQAKSAGSEIPDLHLQMHYSMAMALRRLIFKPKKCSRILIYS